MFVSEWRRSRRNVLALRSSMPRQVEWIWRGGDCAQLQVPRQKCEKRHRLDSGAPGRLGRSVCTIVHGDYELSVGFTRVLVGGRYRGMTLARWEMRWYTIDECTARVKAVTADVILPWQ